MKHERRRDHKQEQSDCRLACEQTQNEGHTASEFQRYGTGGQERAGAVDSAIKASSRGGEAFTFPIPL